MYTHNTHAPPAHVRVPLPLQWWVCLLMIILMCALTYLSFCVVWQCGRCDRVSQHQQLRLVEGKCWPEERIFPCLLCAGEATSHLGLGWCQSNHVRLVMSSALYSAVNISDVMFIGDSFHGNNVCMCVCVVS